jgi:hypothetical protein
LKELGWDPDQFLLGDYDQTHLAGQDSDYVAREATCRDMCVEEEEINRKDNSLPKFEADQH